MRRRCLRRWAGSTARELREGLAKSKRLRRALPQLVEWADVRGAFHNHTTASDGRNTLVEMTAAAEALGWEYLGIADHSKASFQAKGLERGTVAQANRGNRGTECREAFHDARVLGGTECDILTDGQLDYDDALLAKLDYVVVSVHNAFTQDEATMTARIIRAIEHPRTTMLGHLTGRLLRREGYKVDIAKVIDAAIANGVVVEFNASPWRLDMDWRHWRKAAGAGGCSTSLNPDAHETEGLGHVRAGVNAARKGWLTKEAVLNTRPLAEVRKFLKGRAAR